MLTETQTGNRNVTQNPLFHEDWRDALRHLVKSLGGNEVVGAELFPNKTRKAAGNWLSDCLNPERPAKLDLEDIEGLLKLGREAGIHIGIHFLCDVTSYTKPTTIEPEDTLAEVERQMASHVSELKGLLNKYERATNA